ncbi:type I restriction-modification enzyme R subunit C-terminal domain-containing protein [Cryobacterium sp. Hb1]|uniref:type I restriction-modification enzyme R subunit C-terminal domain-containing protein n=1 Tax=Cryobacterium sp. Hb1 TaxID=1259147 RepID=UPI003519DF8F
MPRGTSAVPSSARRRAWTPSVEAGRSARLESNRSRPLNPEIVTPGIDREWFRERLFAFLRDHADQVVLHKLRAGRQLTDLDLQELERILTESGGFTPAELAGGAMEAHGLGLLIRSVVGLERSAVAVAVAGQSSKLISTGQSKCSLAYNSLSFSVTVRERRIQSVVATMGFSGSDNSRCMV